MPTVLGEILTAIVTPFKGDGSVDLERFRALAAHLVDDGSDGLVVTGTTGESPTLSDDERFVLYEAAVDEVGDRATVIAGTGTYATEHSVHLTERAHEIGVDGFLVVTPYYNKPPVRGIVRHFEAIASVTDRPLIAYNIPGRVVLNLETEAIAQLSEIPAVTAVKQANPDLEQARRIVELGLDLYAGDDDLVFPFLELGGRGGVCVHTHVVGPQVKEMVRFFRAGDVEEARALDEELRPSIDLLRVVVNPIAIKCALNLLGHEVGGLRLPLVEATDEEREAVRGCLEQLGLLEPSVVRARPPRPREAPREQTPRLRLDDRYAQDHPARRPRRGGEEHDGLRDRGRDPDRRCRPRVPARRASGRRPAPPRRGLPAG
jgi:4-hydroxy-tetrahydrodipicolinate synthase